MVAPVTTGWSTHCPQGLRSVYAGLPAWQWLVLAGVPLLLYLFYLGEARSLTDHEVYLAGPSKQMVLDRDYLIPRMGYDTWLEKPPLPNWLIIASAWLCGSFTEFSARLPMALAGVGTVLIAAWLHIRLFGPKVGFLAGLVLATSAFLLGVARQAVADPILVLIVIAALAVFARTQFERPGSDAETGGASAHAELSRVGTSPPGAASGSRAGFDVDVLAFWGLVGLANLAKGMLFGSFLVLLTCGGWLLVSGRLREWRRWLSPMGILLCLAIALPWPLATLWQYPETWDLWFQHLFGRFSGVSLEVYHRPVWYYLPSALWQWLPWTPALLVGAAASLREAWREPASPHRFVWWWFLSQLAILTCSAGKNHLYLLYALPALAPVAALGLLKIGESIMAGAAAWRWLGRLGLAAPLAGIAAIGVVAVRAPDYIVDAVAMSVLLSGGLAAAGWLVLRRQASGALGVAMALVVVAELYTVAAVLRYRDPARADRAFLAAVDRRLSPDDLLIGADWSGVPRFIFYLDHAVEGYRNASEIRPWPADRHSAYVLARGYSAKALERLGRVTLVAQSAQQRHETSPEGRYTLFRIDRAADAAIPAAPHRGR